MSPNLSFNQEATKKALAAVASDRFKAMSAEAIDNWSEDNAKRLQGMFQRTSRALSGISGRRAEGGKEEYDERDEARGGARRRR